jgi:hypothetical protein
LTAVRRAASIRATRRREHPTESGRQVHL